MMAAGFLKSTVRDMLRHMEIYRTGGVCEGARILSQRSIGLMTAPHTQVLPFYGYGLSVHGNYHGVSLVEHGGNIKGVSVYVSCVPERGITGVVLTNLASSPGGDLLIAAINNVLGLPIATRRYTYSHFTCSPDKLNQYVGAYASGEGAKVEVTIQPDGLDFELAGDHLNARPIGVDTFAIPYKGMDMAVRFLRNARGEAWALALGYRIIRRAD
jgi:CubicO group peptidase (beta-lactamase class C family)